jgi:hypothetical protein
MERGMAYRAADGSVYFSIEKYQASGAHYGRLLHLNFDQMRPGQRVSDLFGGRRRLLVDRFDDVRGVIHRQQIVPVTNLHVARRQDDILALQSRADVGRGEPARLQGA